MDIHAEVTCLRSFVILSNSSLKNLVISINKIEKKNPANGIINERMTNSI